MDSKRSLLSTFLMKNCRFFLIFSNLVLFEFSKLHSEMRMHTLRTCIYLQIICLDWFPMLLWLMTLPKKSCSCNESIIIKLKSSSGIFKWVYYVVDTRHSTLKQLKSLKVNFSKRHVILAASLDLKHVMNEETLG